MSEAHIERIIKGRIKLLLEKPFFGTLAVRLKLVDASKWCPTMATDGRHLYYSTEFMDKLSEEELVFVIGHEVLHCVYDHMGRRGGRHPKLWNIASDYVINGELVDAGVGKIPKSKEIAPCYDKKYDGMYSEQVYDILAEDIENSLKNESEFDSHVDPGNSGNSSDDDDENSDDKNDGTNGPVKMSEEDHKQIQSEMKSALIQAAQNELDKNSHGRGLPGGVKRLLKDLTAPTMRWDELLAKKIISSIPSDYTWSRPSRKTQSQGIYLPSTIKEPTINVAVGIDTSGSINEDMFRSFISEVYGIMEQFKNFELKFFCWDSRCYTMHTINSSNPEDILTVEFEGGGGNNGIEFVYDFMEEHDVTPDNLILFTDGYIFGSWGDEPDYGVITVLWGDDNRNECPYGINVKYEPLK